MTSGEFKDRVLPCYRQMYATAFAILRNPDDASDAVQDAISVLWQNIPKDMEADRKLFSVMREFDPLPSECEVPHNLINRIEDIMTESPAMPTIVKRNDTSVDDTLITEESNYTATPNSQQDWKSDNQYNESKEKNEGFIEVTDPEEVKKIALGIGKLLAHNSEKTNDAISHISTTIDSYKEITKSILKNETN